MYADPARDHAFRFELTAISGQAPGRVSKRQARSIGDFDLELPAPAHRPDSCRVWSLLLALLLHSALVTGLIAGVRASSDVGSPSHGGRGSLGFIATLHLPAAASAEPDSGGAVEAPSLAASMPELPTAIAESIPSADRLALKQEMRLASALPSPKRTQAVQDVTSSAASPAMTSPVFSADTAFGGGGGMDAPPGGAMPDSGEYGDAHNPFAAFGKNGGPSYRRFVPPAYPAAARRNGISGQVILRVRIDGDGKAVQIQTLQSADAALDRSAIESVRSSDFNPLLRDGRTASCWTHIPIRFQLN